MDRFDALVDEALRATFEGWDFSWLDGRVVEELLPWDYVERVRRWIPRGRAMLDLGTGGGERLASMAPLTVATESYAPNVVVAARRLPPLGAHVVWAHDEIQDTFGPDANHAERRLPLPGRRSGRFPPPGYPVADRRVRCRAVPGWLYEMHELIQREGGSETTRARTYTEAVHPE